MITKKYPAVIVDRLTAVVSAADRAVKPHDHGDRAIDLFRGRFLLVRSGVGFAPGSYTPAAAVGSVFCHTYTSFPQAHGVNTPFELKKRTRKGGAT